MKFKINDIIVAQLNVGLQDLYFEVGLLSRLEEFKDQQQLEEFLNRKFEREVLPNVEEEDGTITVGEEVISDEEKMRDSLQNAIKEVKVSSYSELIVNMSKRYNVKITNAAQASRFAKTTRDRIANIVQVDKVTESLVGLGLKKSSKKEIDEIRDKEVKSLMDLLLEKVEE